MVEKIEGKERGGPAIARELWFRKGEKKLLRGKKFTATVRAGDRTEGTTDPKGGYREGGFITLKIQKDGGQFDAWQNEAVVHTVLKKRIGDIEPDDLEGTPLPQKTKTAFIEKLTRLYERRFTDKDIVTIVRFEYTSNLKEGNDLVRTNVLAFAHEPNANPESLDFLSYTLPLVEHDYPAKTPVMWNVAYHEFGLEASNVMLVGDPKQSVHVLDVFRRDEKYRGGGVGVGFKDEVISHLDELEPLAKEIGAVNFILKTPEGTLRGVNTDGLGYAQSLEEAFKKRNEVLAGKKAVILGAGGTGNAVAFALAEKRMRIVILNRTVSKAQVLAEKIRRYVVETGSGEMVKFGGEAFIAAEIKDADAVINVSTKGAAGELEKYSALAPATLPAIRENIQKNLEQSKVMLQRIPKKAMISDIVLSKKPTPFLQTAKHAGFETLDGIPMVINQGVEAFWLLHGDELRSKSITKEQVAEVMRRAAGS